MKTEKTTPSLHSGVGSGKFDLLILGDTTGTMAERAAQLGLTVEMSTDAPDDLLRSARHVHAGSFYRVPELAARLAVLFKDAKNNKSTTSLAIGDDPSGRWDRLVLDPVLRVTDTLLLNAAEAHALTGHPVLADAAGILARRGPLVVVKDGTAGALSHDGSKARPAPARAVKAGDNFDAAYLAALLKGLGREQALALAAGQPDWDLTVGSAR